MVQTYQFTTDQSVIRLHRTQLEKYILSSSQIASFLGRSHILHKQVANLGSDRRLVFGHLLQLEQNIHSQIRLIGLDIDSNKLAAGRFGKRYRVGFFPVFAGFGCIVLGKIAIAEQRNGFEILSIQLQSLAQALTRSLVMAQFQEIGTHIDKIGHFSSHIGRFDMAFWRLYRSSRNVSIRSLLVFLLSLSRLRGCRLSFNLLNLFELSQLSVKHFGKTFV